MGEVSLQIIPVTPAGFCMPWHARGYEQDTVHGGSCCWCAREIAVPNTHKGLHVACIYCGFDRGLLEAVEKAPDWMEDTPND